MTFEFDYNDDTDKITITYDGTCVLTASFDGERPKFTGFEKLDDETLEIFFKGLCRSARALLA